jgi:hypothetical protein
MNQVEKEINATRFLLSRPFTRSSACLEDTQKITTQELKELLLFKINNQKKI